MLLRHKHGHFICIKDDVARLLNTKGYAATSIWEFASQSDHDAAMSKYSQLLKSLYGQLDSGESGFYDYPFSLFAIPCIFWELAISRCLSRLQPTHLLIPKLCHSNNQLTLGSDPMASYEKFLQWASVILIEELAQQSVEVVEAYDISPLLSRSSEKQPASIVDICLSLLNLSAILIDKLGHVIQGTSIGRENHYGSRSKSLLLLAQPAKSRHLRSYLNRHRINYSAPKSYCGYLRDCTGSLMHDERHPFSYTLRVSPQSTLYHSISDYFSRLDLYDGSIYPSLSKVFFESHSSPLITDAYHDSFVRRLYAQIQGLKGWKFISIPEGADSFYARPATDQFAKPSGLNHIKYVFSHNERQLGIDSGESPDTINVCGYNTSLLTSSFYGHLLRLILRLFLGAADKKIIFYNHHLVRNSDLGVDRLSEFNDKQLSEDIAGLLASIDLSEYYILTSGRCSQKRLELIGCGSIRRVNMHWSILSQACDVMISSRSSLLPEAAALGVPTIFWDPRPIEINRVYATTLSSCTQVVHSSAELRSALLRVFSRRSPRRQVDTHAKYLSPPRYLRLIREIASD